MDITNAFLIRYVKLHFTVEFVEHSVVPIYKASALRGGMGEMLLRANCISDRICENCDFESECLVRRIMYSHMEIQPSFMTAGDSVGYVIECEDYHEVFEAGDCMHFNVILLGKTIVYFSQILNAFYALGISGFGRENSKFNIVSVTNSTATPILSGNNIEMEKYRVQTVREYIQYRRQQIKKNTSELSIQFQSPLSLKFRGEELRTFRIDALIEAACRRIYMLDCFEGIDSLIHEMSYVESIPAPMEIFEEHRQAKVKRYSYHKNQAIYLRGIEGKLVLADVTDDLLDILLAVELVHIGKNTSFGFGRLRIQAD